LSHTIQSDISCKCGVSIMTGHAVTLTLLTILMSLGEFGISAQRSCLPRNAKCIDNSDCCQKSCNQRLNPPRCQQLRFHRTNDRLYNKEEFSDMFDNIEEYSDKVDDPSPSPPIRPPRTPGRAQTPTPSQSPTELPPTLPPSTLSPTPSPITPMPTSSPSQSPTELPPTLPPSTLSPTPSPITPMPTPSPITPMPTPSPSQSPTELPPTLPPSTLSPTPSPITPLPTPSPTTPSPTSSPTRSQPIFPTPRPPIPVEKAIFVGNDDDDSTVFPLGNCQGDCDNDSDCEGNLRCFHRSRGEAVQIPGCLGATAFKGYNTDFCYSPDAEIVGGFKLKLYWQQDYYWQEERIERKWCMQCRGGSCDSGDSIHIRKCDTVTTYFSFIDIGNNAIQVAIAGTTLCLQEVRKNGSRHDIEARNCDENNIKQQWTTRGNGNFRDADSVFEFHPKWISGDRQCITQDHHPKDFEEIHILDCHAARSPSHESSQWNRYD